MNLPFVKERRERWNRLNELLEKIGRNKLNALTKNELIEFSVLYRQVSSDLAIAKSQALPQDIIDFLNDLTGRAYNQMYRPKQTKFDQITNLITYEFPSMIRQNWRIILFSVGLMFLGWLLGFLGYLAGPDAATQFLPHKLGQELIKRYESNTWFNDPLTARPYISARIMLNNIQVAINAFGGGMLLGTLTLYVLFFNGYLLGVLSALFLKKGYFLSFWAMILPHGVIELTAIVLAAAAGFLLAYTILFPGKYSRSDALKIYGQTAVKLISGTIFLLVIAGLIEGFLSTIGTQIISEEIRLIFAAFTGVLLILYLSMKPKARPAFGEIIKVKPGFNK